MSKFSEEVRKIQNTKVRDSIERVKLLIRANIKRDAEYGEKETNFDYLINSPQLNLPDSIIDKAIQQIVDEDPLFFSKYSRTITWL